MDECDVTRRESACAMQGMGGNVRTTQRRQTGAEVEEGIEGRRQDRNGGKGR